MSDKYTFSQCLLVAYKFLYFGASGTLFCIAAYVYIVIVYKQIRTTKVTSGNQTLLLILLRVDMNIHT